MPKRIKIEEHLSIDELERRYRQAKQPALANTLSNYLVASQRVLGGDFIALWTHSDRSSL
ncbi:hypothetical protein [Calothrix sp. NIES-2098]|uniref:hypothetical protein n=1 Tax=Calothrix sp. NIES-2098 TaxID=1954171 RepID=UPI000B5F4E34|nr:hypothetical protein NIES2098_07690 [Calothrix sp. NIES-2098]